MSASKKGGRKRPPRAARPGPDSTASTTPAAAEFDLDRDSYLRDLIRELSGSLQELIGEKETAGFVSVVGARLGDRYNRMYRKALATSRLDLGQVVDALIDLKHRVHGDFYVIEATPERIVLGNRACPFGNRVIGRPSLCMMTSNMFGRIAAENLGYARVRVEEAIARGDAGCRIVIELELNGESSGEEREYFQVGDGK